MTKAVMRVYSEILLVTVFQQAVGFLFLPSTPTHRRFTGTGGQRRITPWHVPCIDSYVRNELSE